MAHIGKNKKNKEEEPTPPPPAPVITRATMLTNLKVKQVAIARDIVLEELLVEEDKLRGLLVDAMGSVNLPLSSMLAVLRSIDSELVRVYDKKMLARGE